METTDGVLGGDEPRPGVAIAEEINAPINRSHPGLARMLDNLEIIGPGASLLTISRDSSSPNFSIFTIDGSDVTGLTVNIFAGSGCAR